jgi:hypothetical protein
MASATWRLRRLWQIETQLMNGAMAPEDKDPFPKTAKAFSKLAAGPDLDLIDRYESRLHRIYHRSLMNLRLLRDIDRELEEREAPEETEPETVETVNLPNEASSEQPEQNVAVIPEHSDEEKSRLSVLRELCRQYEDPNADQGEPDEASRPEQSA